MTTYTSRLGSRMHWNGSGKIAPEFGTSWFTRDRPEKRTEDTDYGTIISGEYNSSTKSKQAGSSDKNESQRGKSSSPPTEHPEVTFSSLFLPPMKKTNTMTQRLYDFLVEFPSTRDDDTDLLDIYRDVYLPFCTAQEILEMEIQPKIKRERALIQQKCPETRGTKWHDRQKYSKVKKDEIRIRWQEMPESLQKVCSEIQTVPPVIVTDEEIKRTILAIPQKRGFLSRLLNF